MRSEVSLSISAASAMMERALVIVLMRFFIVASSSSEKSSKKEMVSVNLVGGVPYSLFRSFASVTAFSPSGVFVDV